MYTDIGLRNHQSVMKQGTKVAEKLTANGQLQLSESYRSCLRQMDALFTAANIVANR